MVWPDPVDLEPPFVPFVRKLPDQGQAVDDGRRPGVLERAWTRLCRAWGRPEPEPDETTWMLDDDLREPPLGRQGCEPIQVLSVRTSDTHEIKPDLAEQLLLAVASLGARVCFEFVGSAQGVSLQFAASRSAVPAIAQVLETYVPDLTLTQGPDALARAWDGAGHGAVVDLGLSREFMLPLTTPRSFAVDPLLPFLSVLNGLGAEEAGAIQVLFEQVENPWAENALKAVTGVDGRPFFSDAPETLRLARDKLARPLLVCGMRVAGRASSEQGSWQIVRRLLGGFSQFSNPPSNELISLSNDNYPDPLHESDLLERQTRRSGMLLASNEVSALVHLPSSSVRAPALRGSPLRTKPPPGHSGDRDILLGRNAHRGQETEVWQSTAQRLRHTYVIGATGTGKSTLLLHLLQQDMEAGRGVALIDPHGDLADDLLARIPERRHEDVVLFDPADAEYPIAFNVLHAHSEQEKELLASDFVAIFRRFSTTWGDQMTAVLANAVLAILESPEGGTLLDLRQFLLDKEFRKNLLSTVEDPRTTTFWDKEFPLLYGRAQVPILTRLDAFLRSRLVRNIVSQKQNRLDLAEVMNQGQIFIARLSQGAIGESNAHLLGSFLIAKFSQMAASRQARPQTERRPFLLYLDEFHNFATPSLISMLSGARKYGVGLVLAHQELAQLRDKEMRGAVFGNAGTRVCFRLGDEDARSMASGFAGFEASDLQNLRIGQAICRSDQAQHDFNLQVPPPVPSSEDISSRRHKDILTISRQRYATQRTELELTAASPPSPTPQPLAKDAKADRAPSPALSPLDSDVPSAAAPNLECQPVTSKPVRAPRPDPLDPDHLPGHGGPQHRYLQAFLKSYAESKGYHASLEAPVEGGGRIDLLLRKGERSLACEVSVTSTPAQEAKNLRKCLQATIGPAVVVTLAESARDKISAHIQEHFDSLTQARVHVCTIPEFTDFLDNFDDPDESETEGSVLGYQVKTKICAGQAAGDRDKHRTLIQTVLRSLRRMKGG